MDELENLFLSKESLLRIMTYMCRNGTDPIVETLVIMLTKEIQFAVNRYGLVLFKGHVFPFSYMTPEQRHCLYTLVAHVVDRQHSAFACVDDPLTFDVEDGHVVFTPVLRLTFEQVFDVLITALERTKRSSRTLCNVILQKLSSRMTITREKLLYVNEKSKSLSPD